MDFFERNNVPIKTERGRRVFPASDRSNDILKALVNYAQDSGAKFMYNSPVRDILCENGKVTGVKLENNHVYELDSVILSTGGLSYPATGSTGDGYSMAEKLGHTIIDPKPSLVPLETCEKWVRDVQGLALKNVGLTVYDNKGTKVFYEQERCCLHILVYRDR